MTVLVQADLTRTKLSGTDLTGTLGLTLEQLEAATST